MFVPRKIVDFNVDREIEIDKKHRNVIESFSYLNFFNRQRLRILVDSKFKLIHEVEEETGWMYLPDKFVYFSDFYFDGHNSDIAFSTHEVISTKDGYRSKSSTDRELEFLCMYKDALDRIRKLDKKINKLLVTRNVISIKDYLDERDRREIVSGSYETMADTFVSLYGIDAVLRLVELLNNLTNMDTDTAYDMFTRSNISRDMKVAILGWVSTYSGIGRTLLDRYGKEGLKNRNTDKKAKLKVL